jgi:hypothetical protein
MTLTNSFIIQLFLRLPRVLPSGGVPSNRTGAEEKLKDLSFRGMLQELSEVRMVHLKAGERPNTASAPSCRRPPTPSSAPPKCRLPVKSTPSINREQLLEM